MKGAKEIKQSINASIYGSWVIGNGLSDEAYL